jgi:hypothetical protein
MKDSLILERNNFYKLLNSKLGDVKPLLSEGLSAIFAAALKTDGGRKTIKKVANTILLKAEDLRNITIPIVPSTFKQKLAKKYDFTISISLKITKIQILEISESNCKVKISASCSISYNSPNLTGNAEKDIVNVGNTFLDQMGQIKIESYDLTEAVTGMSGRQTVNAILTCDCNYSVVAAEGFQQLTLTPASYYLTTSALNTPYGGSIYIKNNKIYFNTKGLAGLPANVIEFGNITEFKELSSKIQSKIINIEDKELSSYVQQ